ncbi:hypothetical protein evm_006919 [Chilo suppressalis]|nr:hypothetical protein evm_006919 [Chilo suppressalis]
MNSGNVSDTLVNKLPTIRKCCFLVVLTGLTCATVVLVRDKEHLTMTAVLLTLSISLFIVSTLMFIIVSLMLTSAGSEEDPDLMSQYIWLAIAYLSVQSVLAVAIPVLLVVDGKYPITIVLIWMVVVLLICLCWTHFISVVNTYRIRMF